MTDQNQTTNPTTEELRSRVEAQAAKFGVRFTDAGRRAMSSDNMAEAATTIMIAANALRAMADAKFAAWLEQQSDEVRAMTKAEQLEVWADPSLLDQPQNPWQGFGR